MYTHTRIIVYVETCADWLRADDYAEILSANVPNLEVFSGDSSKQRRKGVVTTRHTKEVGLLELQERLDDGSIHFANMIVSSALEADRAELLLQAGRFRRDVALPRDMQHGKPRNTLTGKGGGGQQDDLIMGLQQVLVYAKDHVTTLRGEYT